MDQQKCKYFISGFCRYSDRCRYSHDFEGENENISSKNLKNTYWNRGRLQNSQGKLWGFQRVTRENEETERRNEDFQEVAEYLHDLEDAEDQIRSFIMRRSAKYFYKRVPKWNKRKKSYRTTSERYDNSYLLDDESDRIEKETKVNDENSRETKVNNENVYNLGKFREIEVKQFQKRFPKYREVSEDVFQFEYFPTDPDWPFEVKSINLQVEFPKEYPETAFSITVIDEDDILPDMLIKHINRTLRYWISEKWEKERKVELAFRPFLRWFDKNLEEIFICGLRWTKQDIETKAAGIEFVPYEMLCNSKADSLSNESDSNNDNDSCKDSYEIDENSEESEEIVDENNDISNTTGELSIDDSSKPNKNNYSGIKTEIKFKELHIAGHEATLTCQKLQIVIICNRCKTRHDLTMLPHRLNLATCTKCQQIQELTFQPSLLHPNSSIVGYVHIQNCQIIDLPLVACEFSISCLYCSAQTALTGIHYSQQRFTRCEGCRSKMNITIQGVRFIQLQTQEIIEKYQAHSVKNQILPVRRGCHLPRNGMCKNGMCKHYKKSFRWLIFPCCIYRYPCNICHNRKSAHKMKRATRMICGFCLREQPYTNDECIDCKSYVTKLSSSHWEGGKGCRDKSKMNRSDKHKYVGKSKTKSVKKVSVNIKSAQ